jgi:hypothetical protein
MSETLAKSAGLVSRGPRAGLTRRAILVLLAAIPACAQDASRNEIHFEIVAGVPIIPGVVNGHRARLLVDTGTCPSVFTATLIRDSQSDTFIHATTPGGELFLKVGTASVTVGTLSINLPKVFIDTKLLVSGNADGLLGSDFWAAAGGVVLDYKRRTLTMGAGPRGQ